MKIDLKALASQIGKYAPTIAASLGGPAAGIAVALLEKVFGVSEENLLNTISTDPETILKLKTLENAHSEIFMSLSVKDMMDARDKLSSPISNSKYVVFVGVLAIVTILGFYSSLYFVFIVPEKPGNHDILNMLLGVLATNYVHVMNLFFGLFDKK